MKRNLFEVYLRPHQTTINFISTTTSSSASFPGGEAFDFAFSANGHWILALSSSRIYAIDTAPPRLSVQRELKVRRRPVSAAILDDGSILAVLSQEHEVNICRLSAIKLEHLRSVTLDNRSTAIALSPKGEVLAAAYEGGIEVHSLASNAVSSDRRAVKCDTTESLAFSHDGTMLLGSTRSVKGPNTVILTVPFVTENTHQLGAQENLCQLWTEPILFPNSSRDCSHAILLPNARSSDTTWTFAFDRVFESFRAVRTDDLRNGQTYFTGPKPPRGRGPSKTRKLVPSTLPTSTSGGDMVAAAFGKKEIWLYGIPESLDMSQSFDIGNSPSVVMAGSNLGGSAGRSARSSASHLTRGDSAEMAKLPRWQIMVDKYRNVFAKGHLVADVPGATAMRWIAPSVAPAQRRSDIERLIIAAPGGVTERSPLDDGEYASVDGGRVVILDFGITTNNGASEHITIELGNTQPEELPEGNVDIDAQIAIARRRTVRSSNDPSRRSVMIDALTPAETIPIVPQIPASIEESDEQATTGASEGANHNIRSHTEPASPDGLTLEEASATFDGPYSHTQPRSRMSLFRSATAVAANRQRNPRAPRIVDSGGVQFRRPDGHGELPHESDADNWVPPPPPYTAKAEIPIPQPLQSTTCAVRTLSDSDGPSLNALPRRAVTMQSPPSHSPISRRPLSSASHHVAPGSSMDPALNTSPHAHNPSNRDNYSNNALDMTNLEDPTHWQGSASPVRPRRNPSTDTTRRPASAFIGRFSGSQRPSNVARLSSPISPIPEPRSHIYNRRSLSGSISLPSSPITTNLQHPVSNLTLSGANLQSRLDYPLPPAPPQERITSLSQRPSTSYHSLAPTRQSVSTVDEIERIAASMPSAQQLANISNRSMSRSSSISSLGPRPQSRNQPPPPRMQDAIIPAPPRGALGAAGNRPLQQSSRADNTRRRSTSIGERNSFAASSPALLRPVARRLDTIQSVASFRSTQSQKRPSSRDALADVEDVQPGHLHHHHHHHGDEISGQGPVSTTPKTKRSIFGTKRGRIREQGKVRDGAQDTESSRQEKEPRCVVM